MLCRTAIVGALIALALLGCQSEEERRAAYLERANAYFENEQWGEAKIEFLNLIQLEPDNPEARYNLAETQWALGEYGDALWQYRETVRLAPDNADWRLKLAQVEFAARRTDKASEQIEELLKREPNSAKALVLRARLHGREGDRVAMLEDLDRAIAADPENPTAALLRAQVLTRDERFEEAEAELRRLVEIEPVTGSYILLAAFLSSRERPAEAEASFRKAIEVADKPGALRVARLTLANYYISIDRRDEAEVILLEAREDDPDDTELLVGLARFYVLQDQRDKAVALLEERAAGEPDNPAHLIALAQFHRESDNREAARDALDRALAVDPDNEITRVARAEFLLEEAAEDAEAAEEGRRIIEEVLEANPGSVRAQFTRAKILMIDAEYEEAATVLRRVAEEQPHANAFFMLGTAHQAITQFDLAREAFVRALQLDATHVRARRQLAALYLRNRNYALAAQEAQRGLSTAEGDALLTIILAEALIGERNPNGAREALEKQSFESKDIRGIYRARAAQTYLSLGEVERARKIVLSVLAEEPDNAGALRQLVAIEARAGEPQAALPALNAAIEKSPNNAALYQTRGSFYLGFRRQSDGAPRFPNEARGDLLQAIQLDPEDDRTQVMLGRLRESMGNRKQALESYDRAIELNPRSGEAFLRRGAMYEAEGQKDQAIDNYTRLVQLGDAGGVPDEELAIALNNLAWLLADKPDPKPADLDRALELAQDAKELLPGDPNVADTLGWVMYKRRVPGAAISLFREAIASYAPGSPSRALSRYHLALSYEANGETDLAIDELRKSLDEAAAFPGRDDAETTLQRLTPS